MANYEAPEPDNRVTPPAVDAQPMDDSQLPWRVWVSRNGFFLAMLAVCVGALYYWLVQRQRRVLRSRDAGSDPRGSSFERFPRTVVTCERVRPRRYGLARRGSKTDSDVRRASTERS